MLRWLWMVICTTAVWHRHRNNERIKMVTVYFISAVYVVVRIRALSSNPSNAVPQGSCIIVSGIQPCHRALINQVFDFSI